MMKIIYSKDYIRKSSILNYPYTGYHYQLGRNYPHESNWGNLNEWFKIYSGEEYGVHSYSKTYSCNTMIKKFNKKLCCRISFLPNEIELLNTHDVIYILAIDNTIYNNINELELLPNEDPNKHKKFFSQIAAIIIIGNDEKFRYSRHDTNIIDMQYIPKCSFVIIGDEQVEHYQSELYDKSNLYQATNDQLIELNSANTKLKDLMATHHPIDLQGHMTIRSSGAIHL